MVFIGLSIYMGILSYMAPYRFKSTRICCRSAASTAIITSITTTTNAPTTNALHVRPCLPVANPHSFLPSVHHSTDCLGPISLFSITRTVSFLIVILSLSPWLHTRAQPLHLNPNNDMKARPTEFFMRRATCDMRRHADPTLPCRPRYRAHFRPTSPI